MTGSDSKASIASAEEAERLGVALFQAGRFAEAAAQFSEVARLSPQSSAALQNLGTSLRHAGNLEGALAAYERAVDLDPRSPVARLNVGDLLIKLRRSREAIVRTQETIAAFPDDPNVQYHGGRILNTQGMREEALAAFERALRLDPGFVEARWMIAMASLPQAYGPGEDPYVFRDLFDKQLAYLDEWAKGDNLASASRGVGEGQPFYLAFQERDNLPLLARHGDVCARAMSAMQPSPAAIAGEGGRPVRLAIVSGHVQDQSVWTALVRGWTKYLDRSKIEIHLFHTGTTRDAETEIARSNVARFYTNLGEARSWVDGILSIGPDAILYPEIGMDAMCAKLAALRLAPVQIVSWGHPETSGLPTIDYYLSAAAFEPEGAEAHYRERLVALPGVGCCYEDLVPPFEAPDWAALGVDPYAPRLLCAGTACKYLPEHDPVFLDLARKIPQAQLLFFTDQATPLSDAVHARLAGAFKAAGLEYERHVKLLPRQPRAAFFGMMRDCDALLDTIGFSGFNTAMQALECDLPIVAWEGRFMRGRLASGALREMKMDELVASTTQRYVEIAHRLCTDSTYRLRTAAKLAEQRSVLFGDVRPIDALEAFLFSATGRS